MVACTTRASTCIQWYMTSVATIYNMKSIKYNMYAHSCARIAFHVQLYCPTALVAGDHISIAYKLCER